VYSQNSQLSLPRTNAFAASFDIDYWLRMCSTHGKGNSNALGWHLTILTDIFGMNGIDEKLALQAADAKGSPEMLENIRQGAVSEEKQTAFWKAASQNAGTLGASSQRLRFEACAKELMGGFGRKFAEPMAPAARGAMQRLSRKFCRRALLHSVR
jgi:hypothetical protein